MSMISYAQNAEDVVLKRLFPPGHRGLYIDVGANDPLKDTVTRHFYEQGWQGINVEPSAIFPLLPQHRPRDVNLQLGLSNTIGEKTFYDFVDYPGSSTYCRTEADAHRRERGFQCVERPVRVTTLRAVCEQHVRGPIDFISIDVEGHEREVLEGGDWKRFRPLAVVIEATRPNSTIPAHHQWEPILLEANYCFALFDGLNRFYVRGEDARVLSRLSAPANCCDDFVPHRYLKQIAELHQRAAHEADRVADLLAHEAVRVADLQAHLAMFEGLGPRSIAVARKFHDLAVPLHRMSLKVQRAIARAA